MTYKNVFNTRQILLAAPTHVYKASSELCTFDISAKTLGGGRAISRVKSSRSCSTRVFR